MPAQSKFSRLCILLIYSRWLKQHELLNKLNMQAHVNAMMRADEFVMESLSSLDKVKFLENKNHVILQDENAHL